MDRKLWSDARDEHMLLDGFALASGEALTIRGARGVVLFVEHGDVWVTRERDHRVIVVAGRQWLWLNRGGKAIVQARRDAAVTLTASADTPIPDIQTPGGRARRGNPYLRALLAWWLRLYRRRQGSPHRRFIAHL